MPEPLQACTKFCASGCVVGGICGSGLGSLERPQAEQKFVNTCLASWRTPEVESRSKKESLRAGWALSAGSVLTTLTTRDGGPHARPGEPQHAGAGFREWERARPTGPALSKSTEGEQEAPERVV